MKKPISFALILIILITFSSGPAYAINTNGWSYESINNDYMVMLPPNWSHITMNTDSGPATGFFDPLNPDEIIVILKIDNPFGSRTSKDIKTILLNSFCSGAGIILISDPNYVSDSIIGFGIDKRGNTVGIVVRFIDDQMVFVYGQYGSLDDALYGSERLGVIAGSIILF